ncbi:putative alpha-ketoglutarate-dependent 2,4-dichlorophenoxyacetate dioxygenase [Aureobasidium sp. EXF-12298]|nr:putative alpha-ketoglutarate-dependent 2,4-dichlorophenoxyacetate dioxygenase [Aureobasidium sp. EXF-12298]
MFESLTRVYENKTALDPGSIRLRGEKVENIEGLLIVPVLISEASVFGAEVFGINWKEPIPTEVVKQLIALQDKYAVLIFRETRLDNEGHIAFSKQLGDKLEINPFFYGRENDRVGEPLLFDVGNIELDGSLVKPDSRRWHHSMGNALWHTDSTYHQERSKYSLLLSHGNSVTSGCYTHFADTRRAYSDLPQDLKEELEDMVVEHE